MSLIKVIKRVFSPLLVKGSIYHPIQTVTSEYHFHSDDFHTVLTNPEVCDIFTEYIHYKDNEFSSLIKTKSDNNTLIVELRYSKIIKDIPETISVKIIGDEDAVYGILDILDHDQSRIKEV